MARKPLARLFDNEDDTPSVEKSFLTDLCRSIEMTEKKNQRPSSLSYKPSSMNCIRSMYFQVTGAPVDDGYVPYGLVGICNAGTDIHERTQKYVADMKNNGYDCEYINVADYVREHNLDYLEVIEQCGMETKLYHKDLNIRFLCDGVIKYKGEYYILELKTEASFKFVARRGVDPKHYHQGICYSLALGIDNVIFVYISRDVLDMKSYMFTPKQSQKDALVALIKECDAYVEKCELPPQPAKLPKGTCNYCAYYGLCSQYPNPTE